jgi:hypothetical protein
MSFTPKNIIACIFVMFLSSCSQEETKWSEFTSNEGKFTINMPSPTKKSEKVVETPFGSQKVYFYSWQPPGYAIDKFKLFEVSYTSVPARIANDSELIEEMLDKSIELRKKDFAETDIPAQNIELNGYPGRAFIYNESKGSTLVIVKQCIVNGKRYDLTVVAKKNYGTNKEVSDFFNSFQSLR